MGHSPSLSQAPSRHDASPAPLPLALGASGSATAMRTAEESAEPGHRPGRMAGSESRQGGNRNERDCMHTVGEGLGGCGQGLQSSYILPLQGSGAPLHFLSKMEGEGRGRAPSPPPPQAHRWESMSLPSLIPKGSTARWTTPHSRTNNHSPAPPRPSLPPPSGSDTQERGVPPLPTTDTLQPPGKRERAGGKEEEGW